jgi:hypothetical protein
MKLIANQSIKILFRNNTSAEGIVEVWEDGDYILRSLDGKSILIIQDPVQDIMAIKVMLDDSQEIIEMPEDIATQSTIPPPQPTIEIIEASNDDLRHKKLAELRIAAIAHEKMMVAEKLRSHHISTSMPVKYTFPNLK